MRLLFTLCLLFVFTNVALAKERCFLFGKECVKCSVVKIMPECPVKEKTPTIVLLEKKTEKTVEKRTHIKNRKENK